MHADRRLVSRLLVVSCTATFVALAGLAAGCSEDNVVKTTPVSFYGTFGDVSGTAGTISLANTSGAAARSPLGACSGAIAIAGSCASEIWPQS